MPHPTRRRAVLAAAAVAAGFVVIVVATSRQPGRHSHPTVMSPTVPRQLPVEPALPAPVSERFGVGTQGIFLNYSAYTPEQLNAQFRGLRQTGATIARSDALWEVTEPTPPVNGAHHYHWAFDDATAGRLAANGVRWFPIIDYSPSWASSAPSRSHSPPRSPNDYAAFAAAFAARFGASGAFWRARPNLHAQPVDTYEIWNEPDISEFWGPAPDAARYADLYLRARNAIRAVDPAARVIVGGLVHPTSFLPAMLAAHPDLRGQVDGVAIHPYGPNPFAVLDHVRAARVVLRRLGIGTVPVYVTEFGWTTSPPGALDYLPERLRPGYIAATLGALGHTDCGIAAVLLDTWVTPERIRSKSDDWFGIEPPSGVSSADSEAFVNGLRAATTPGPNLKLCRAG